MYVRESRYRFTTHDYHTRGNSNTEKINKRHKCMRSFQSFRFQYGWNMMHHIYNCTCETMKFKLIMECAKRPNSSTFDICERSWLSIQLKLYLINVLNQKIKNFCSWIKRRINKKAGKYVRDVIFNRRSS